MRYFKKLLPLTAFFGADGGRIEFPVFGPDRHATGLLELADDANQIKDLETAIANGNIGGIVEITREDYEDLKKKLPTLPPKPVQQLFGHQTPPQISRPPNPFGPKDGAVVEAAPEAFAPEPERDRLKEHFAAKKPRVAAPK